MGTGDVLLGATLRWTTIPSRGEWGVAILSVASCYRTWVKFRPCGPPWLVNDFTCLYLKLSSLLTSFSISGVMELLIWRSVQKLFKSAIK